MQTTFMSLNALSYTEILYVNIFSLASTLIVLRKEKCSKIIVEDIYYIVEDMQKKKNY
jgi:hypothetical protein